MFSDAWRPSVRGFASAAKPLRKGAQPPASQPLVLLGVCVGLALAAAPLAFKSVRQREQSVAEMIEKFRASGARIDDLRTEEADLEDVFLALTYRRESA